jgi:hypothetical protein
MLNFDPNFVEYPTFYHKIFSSKAPVNLRAFHKTKKAFVLEDMRFAYKRSAFNWKENELYPKSNPLGWKKKGSWIFV